MKALPALVLLLLLAPPAAGDHVYSHRYVMEGRLMGSDGLPLANRTVEFYAIGEAFDPNDVCADGHAPVTDENGDFRFCFHKHALDPNAEVGARYGSANVTKRIDTAFRRTVVTLEADEPGEAPPGWNVTHRVSGRVWRQGPQQMEGVLVYGATVNHVPVNVTLRAPEGERNVTLTTDGYGDFDLRLSLATDAPAENVTVEIEVEGQRQTRALDPATHRLTVGVVLAPQPGSFPTPVIPPRTAQPGETTPPVHVGLVLAVLAGLVLAVWLARRS